MRDEEDRAWQAIVENYGERPEVEAGPDAGSGEPGETAEPEILEPDAVIEPDGAVDEPEPEADDPFVAEFVPPDPALPPLPPPDRALAWLGVLGSPVALLLTALLRVDLPGLVALGLVAAFVGGFVYLVATMSREPRDPFDDGAQV